MINIYDDVNNLVSNLKKHELTVNFKEIRKKLKEENEELFKKIEEFQKLNIEINTKMYKAADVAVFPSTYEPFRNSCIRRNASEKSRLLYQM